MPTPLSPSQRKSPMTPPWFPPKAREYPKSAHMTTASPIMDTQAIMVLTTFFLRTSPP